MSDGLIKRQRPEVREQNDMAEPRSSNNGAISLVNVRFTQDIQGGNLNPSSEQQHTQLIRSRQHRSQAAHESA